MTPYGILYPLVHDGTHLHNPKSISPRLIRLRCSPLFQYGPADKPVFNEDTGRWEIAKPGWVWYADEEPEPDLDDQMREKRKTIKTFTQQIPGGGNIAKDVMNERGKTKDTLNLDDLDAIINALLQAKAEQDSGAND